MKLNRSKKTLRVIPHDNAWFLSLRFKYDPTLKDYIKQFPGATWEPTDKTWKLPQELMICIDWKAKELGYEVIYEAAWLSKAA